MAYLYPLIRFYPYWGLALALLMLEMVWHYRRKKSKQKQVAFFVLFLLLIALAAGWVLFRGDKHSLEWAQFLMGEK